MSQTNGGRPAERATSGSNVIEPEVFAERSVALWQDADLVLRRAISRSDSASVLLLAAVSARPSREVLDRLKHEYELRHHLDTIGAVRPRALVSEHGRPALELEDPGGCLLSSLIGQSIDVATFLRIAVGISAALAGVHNQELIHKNVRPATILYTAATGEIRLTGFGFASRPTRELHGAESNMLFEGTIEYMAPEQTGRINRSVAAPSDLYALGVTLYELCTGELPFAARTPLEWVHCHVAKVPIPVLKRRPDLPSPLAAIIMRLLEKAPEDRYQTALGVESDLRRCLELWERQRSIPELRLGENDIPDRLVLPERLYGRGPEVLELLAAFERVAARGACELVLVSGQAGIGKSAMVYELERTLAARPSAFVAGKFAQYTASGPYRPLAQVCGALVRRLLGKAEEELRQWRSSLLLALGSNARLLCDLVPELELAIGAPPEASPAPLENARARLRLL